MAPNVALRLVSRGGKQIKKLPASIEVSPDVTVEDVKILIARQTGTKDFNRIGLYDPGTKKTLKNRKAPLHDNPAVLSRGELQVKDLGPQMAWATVYMVEYFGPILFHALFVALRPYIYRIPPFDYKNERESSMTAVQWLLFTLIQAHFFKREFETAFIHRFSANTMPAWNIFRNSSFYWFLAGLLPAIEIYAPGSLAARTQLGLLDYLCLALFFGCEVCNAIVHVHLASLRSRGGTEKGIPNCIGSSLVTCPNYMFEVIAWAGVIVISRSPMLIIFISVGMLYMRSWSRDKEKALRQTFGDRYKKKRYTMLPGLI